MTTVPYQVEPSHQPLERGGWFGPIFFWELKRESRKGNNYLPRVFYAGGLLLLLYIVMGRVAITKQRASELSEEAFKYYLLYQYIAVFLLTPVYVVGAIIADRQQRMFSLLLTTYLTPREIVLGKLMGRLVPILGILLAGVPVLAILQLIGGIGFGSLLFHSLLSLLLLVFMGMFSIRASTLCKTVGSAVLSTYAAAIVPVLIMIPVALIFLQARIHYVDLLMGLALVWGYFLLARRALRKSIESISRRDRDQDFSISDMERLDQVLMIPAPVEKLMPGEQVPPVSNQPSENTHRFARFLNPPRVRSHPIIWKETHFPLNDMIVVFALLACGFPILIFINELHKSTWYFSRYSQILLALLFSLIGIRAAGTLSTERKMYTLLSLLATPLSWSRVLIEFSIGSAWRYRWFAVGVLLLTLLTNMFDMWSISMIFSVFISQMFFFAMLGVACSLLFQTAFQARLILCVFVLFSFLVLPWIKDGSDASYLWLLEMLVAPYPAWPRLLSDTTLDSFYAGESSDSSVSMGAVFVLVINLLLIWGVTVLLFWYSRYRLRRWLERGMS